ncbi:MAG: hypothetical protein WA771_09565 [Chthoniobacterales bacterium]
MKFFLIPILVVAVAWSASAETAYEALQVIKGDRGDAILDQLVEARGEGGDPQPQTWTIVMIDPSARTGIREFVVSRGRIQSERTPVRGYDGLNRLPPINFTRLNLDSDGAFSLAEKEATREKVGFNSIDYTLRTQVSSGSPIWVVRLFDYMGAPVGTVEVSAETGKVAKSLRLDPDARLADDRQFVEEERVEVDARPGYVEEEETVVVRKRDAGYQERVYREQPRERDEMGGVFGFVKRRAEYDANKVKNVTLRTAGTIQKFLTGRDTVSPEEDGR